MFVYLFPCIALEDMIEPRQTICVSRSFSKEITSLQELSEQVANFAESAVTKLRGQNSIALEMVVFAMTNRFRQDAPQAYASKYVVIPDGTADHRIFIRHALEGCRDLFREGYGYKKAGVVITKLVQEDGFAPFPFLGHGRIGKGVEAVKEHRLHPQGLRPRRGPSWVSGQR